MVVQEDIPMMELFRKSVNASREALAKVEVREELTYHYAIVRVYSKMLVTSCAIYTLLINGYLLEMWMEENNNHFGIHRVFYIAPQALSTIIIRKCVLKA